MDEREARQMARRVLHGDVIPPHQDRGSGFEHLDFDGIPIDGCGARVYRLKNDDQAATIADLEARKDAVEAEHDERIASIEALAID